MLRSASTDGLAAVVEHHPAAGGRVPESIKFRVPRYNDRDAFLRLKQAVSAHIAPNWSCASLFGRSFSGNLEQDAGLQAILEAETIAVRVFTVTLQGGTTLQLSRDITEGRLQGLHDWVTLGPPNNPQSPQVSDAELAKLLKAARSALKAVDEKEFVAYVNEGDRAFYEAREAALQRQQDTLD